MTARTIIPSRDNSTLKTESYSMTDGSILGNRVESGTHG